MHDVKSPLCSILVTRILHSNLKDPGQQFIKLTLEVNLSITQPKSTDGVNKPSLREARSNVRNILFFVFHYNDNENYNLQPSFARILTERHLKSRHV